MSIIKSEDEKKWLNAFLVLSSVLLGYLSIRFFYQLGEWFDLESKVAHFWGVAQGLGVVVGVVAFVVTLKNQKAMTYLNEVYRELVKVIWPERDSVAKLTVGLVIGLIIISLLLMLVDYLAQGLLNIFYSL